VDERRARQAAARAALVGALTEERLAGLQADFAGALERAIEPRRHRRKKRMSAAELSFREMGREIILARLEELRELSTALSRPFKTVPLHEMRIAAKRLRYAMELFAACYNEELTEHAGEVAELQTSLGELHDGDVWLEGLGQMLRDFKQREKRFGSSVVGTSVQKQRAVVWLLRHFAKARMKHFGSALACWHEWETGGSFAHLIESIDARPPAVELSPVALTLDEAVASDIEASEPS
jgi:CHAD domain-containing protein